MPNPIDNILLLTNDLIIGDDGWSDVFHQQAINLAKEVFEKGEENHLYKHLDASSETARLRLLSVLLAFQDTARFNQYLSIASDSDAETAELIFDNLRSWQLNDEQANMLIVTYLPFKGQSKLLDYIMHDFMRGRK